MAASASLSYATLSHHHHVQKGLVPYGDMYVITSGITAHHCVHAKRSFIGLYQQHSHPGSTLKCRSMHGTGEDRFGKWASEKEAWRALKDQIEAFRGEFPDGAAETEFRALVDQLDAAANPASPAMQILLGQAKRFLKCPRASLVHYLNLVRNAENLGHPQLGAWYLETGLACREAGDLEGALHFCSKALEASMERYGPSSLLVAQARSALSKVYFNLARYSDSIRQGEMARPILKESGSLEEVISLELTMADTLSYLKKYEEVVSVLNEVINSIATTGLVHINANISMAKAYAAMGRNADAKAQCKKAFDALDFQEPSVQTAAHYVMLASMYEQQEDFEQAALVITKSLSMFEKFPQNSPQDFIAELEGKLGRILLQLRNAEEALPYLERHLKKKRSSAGSFPKGRDAQELLYAHYYLGAAYSQCEKFHTALEQFEACMLLLSDTCTGENPSLAMTVYNNAASMHYHLDKLDKAIECQRSAVNVMKKNKLEETNTTKRIEALLEEYLQEANSPESKRSEIL